MKTLLVGFLLTISLTACGGGGGGASVMPSTGFAPPTISIPTPVAPAGYIAIGDSITFGMYATDYATQGYAFDLAADLNLKLTNLGIPGETSTNVIPDEVMKIPSGAQVITVFIGTNDELQFAEKGSDPMSVETTFALNMTRIAAVLHGQFSGARVFIANLPNLANFPQWKNASLAQRTAISQLNQQMNKTIDGMGFPVVDLRCDPRNYVQANMYDGGLGYGYVHPNTQGHAYYADDFNRTIQGSLAESQTCSFVTPV